MTPTPPLTLLDGSSWTLDNSSFQLMCICPQMAAYKLLHKRERAGTAIERDAGKALHVALEHRYRKLGSAACDAATEAEMLALLEREFEGMEVPMETHLTLARCKEAVVEYNKARGAEPFKVLAVEMPYAVPLGTVKTRGVKLPPEVQIIWTGRSDLITEWEGGEVHTTDHKSTSRWDASKQAGFAVDDGQKGYAWSCQELARLHPEAGLPKRVHGFCVNNLTIRPELKRASANALPRFEFNRVRFYWTQAMLEEWRTNTLAIIEGWLEHYERGYFPMHRRNCANLYGRACGYKDVDDVPPEQRALVLGSDLYQDATWSPLERERKSGNGMDSP